MDPLITAIMPARGRPELAAAAVECWRRQTWPNTELVIVDDGDMPAFPVPLPFEGLRVQYRRLPKRLTIGAKRNLACEMAAGEFIMHQDSDDWSAPGRVADQFERLVASGLSMTGYHTMLFTDGQRWWRYDGPKFKGGMGAFGTSFFYRRDWWEHGHRFQDGPKNRLDCADNPFCQESMRLNEFVAAPAGEMMFAQIHKDNTSPKCTSGSRWKPCSPPSCWPLL